MSIILAVLGLILAAFVGLVMAIYTARVWVGVVIAAPLAGAILYFCL